MTSLLDRVRADTARVMARARHVSIDLAAARTLAKDLAGPGGRPPEWNRELQYGDGTPVTAEWVFVLDSLNFCFWPDPGQTRWTVDYAGRRHRGYFALSSALKRAVEQGVPVFDAAVCAEMAEGDLGRILGGNGELPLLRERTRILRDNGKTLLREFGGRFQELLESCQGSAAVLVGELVSRFPSFADVATYDGRPVHLLKRAQILVSDLWGAFGGQGLGCFADMDRLTAFADYRVPQILRSLGVIAYASELARKVDTGVFIESGSPEEVEIRAATVQAVEIVTGHMRKEDEHACPFSVDWWLWDRSHLPEHNLKPYHLTRSIWY